MRLGKLVLGLVAVALVSPGCGKKETPIERVTRLRQQHTVQPNGFQPRLATDGTQEVALDLVVVNNGREGLDQVTLLVHVIGPDGNDRAASRAVVDTSHLIPGVTEQISTIVTGLEVAEGDSLTVELEYEPSVEVLSQYPEYRVAGSHGAP